MSADSPTPDAEANLAEWGKSVLEELLVRAGLDLPAAQKPSEAAVATLQFRVSADEASKGLEILCETVGGRPIILALPLSE